MAILSKRLSCVFIVIFALTPIVFANERSITNQVLACSEIREDSQRLHCFDTISHKDNLAELHEDAFAREQLKNILTEPENEVNTITLTISELSKTLRGQWLITAENGQRWQQKDSTRLALKVKQRVVVSKGALGATYLQKENSTKRISVKRLK